MDRPMNMAQLAAFRFLGLTSDADEAAVRRAYAQRLKTCSPETDPQAWMRLHSAFKSALSVFELPASDRQGGGASPDEFDPEPQSGTEEDTFQSLFDNIEQLAGEADEEERQRQLKRIPERFPDLVATSSTSNNIELNHADANKGKAMLALAQVLGVAREETLAFGDGSNDSSMLRAAGWGVAMANSTPDVKDAADEVTMSNNDAGVAKALRRILATEEKL